MNNLLSPFRSAGWTFSTGADLAGSFNISGFEAYGALNSVGANLYLNYFPIGNDPVNDDQTEVHWIQRVICNNNATDNSGYGNPEDTIDVPDRSLPYTDPGRLFFDYKNGFPTPPIFQDGPDRVQVDGSNKWSAELYLASFKRDDPYNVRIHNGVTWGWKNEHVVDFEFVVDTTGSMGFHLTTAQATMRQFLSRLDESDIDYRVAIADFKDFPSSYDPDDYPYRANLAFTSDKQAIDKALSLLVASVGSGGDIPESIYSALIRAMQTEDLGSWRSGSERVTVLMTDAPPHDPEPYTDYTLQDVVNKSINQDKVRIFSLIPNANSDAVFYFSSLASQTNGNICATTESCAEVFAALLAGLTYPSSSGGSGGSNIGNIILSNHEYSLKNQPSEAVPEPSTMIGMGAASVLGWLFKKRGYLNQTTNNRGRSSV